jgi:hypothetical protein
MFGRFQRQICRDSEATRKSAVSRGRRRAPEVISSLRFGTVAALFDGKVGEATTNIHVKPDDCIANGIGRRAVNQTGFQGCSHYKGIPVPTM